MNNKGKISIIVAVYKAEKYIERCIKSILSQSYKNIEIILVDDGSPDKSGDICDKYASLDNRIISLHEPNAGVSGARENGLNHSSGEFVLHVDPDDWIEEDMIQSMYSKAITGAFDIVVCDFCMEHNDGEKHISKGLQHFSLNKIEMFRKVLKNEVSISNCNRLVRKDLFDKYDIHFPVGYNIWEDYYINSLLFSHMPKVGYVEKALYHVDRFSNDNSLSRHYSTEELKCLKHYIELFKIQMPKEVLCYIDDAKLMVKNCAFYRLRDVISKKEFDSIYPEIRKVYVKSHLSLHLHELGAALAGIGLFKLGKYVYSKKLSSKTKGW